MPDLIQPFEKEEHTDHAEILRIMDTVNKLQSQLRKLTIASKHKAGIKMCIEMLTIMKRALGKVYDQAAQINLFD